MRMRVLAAVAAVAVVSSCGVDAGSASNAIPPQPLPAPSTPPPAPVPLAGDSVELDVSPTLAAIRQRRMLRVGVRADTPQFVTRDAAGEYQGFDAEIARDLARRIGLDAGQVQFRRLPPTLLVDAVATGNVDVLLGGTADTPQLIAVGPYVVTDAERYLVIRSDDRLFAEELRALVAESVADGSWQRAYETTLRPAGIQARPGS
ncbi:hypothetical protein GCM10011581_38080 [Saccharopolyspora subtropica]|uniref:Solute-binding protein family 3/N-terminal domain-containing protein n=2 Tax=Saccharopolyspora thermophila TaxID=89367 RepID=A0A917K277_9PSEU|nr:hypothetical protein GCM10011581_38080 [Saccharopolyspora subtropica]